MKRENSDSSKNPENNTENNNKFVDDGRTVYDMSGLNDMHSTGPRRKKQENVNLTRKEKRALLRAAFAHYAPIFFGVIVCFTLAALLIYLWLK